MIIELYSIIESKVEVFRNNNIYEDDESYKFMMLYHICSNPHFTTVEQCRALCPSDENLVKFSTWVAEIELEMMDNEIDPSVIVPLFNRGLYWIGKNYIDELEF
jgi:hypothetical protein